MKREVSIALAERTRATRTKATERIIVYKKKNTTRKTEPLSKQYIIVIIMTMVRDNGNDYDHQLNGLSSPVPAKDSKSIIPPLFCGAG